MTKGFGGLDDHASAHGPSGGASNGESADDVDDEGDEQALLDAADDFADRHRRGERPSVEEYAARHPSVADRIRALFPAMIEIERSAAGQSHASAAAAAATDAEGLGHVIGRYKILERIGEGGFGVVYMAQQQHPVRRKVALKVIKPGLDTRQVIARFEAERQALALMEHENVARVLDAGATDAGRPYFVMELVQGVPITDFCDRNRLTARERLELFVPVCLAVQHAHQKGVIHRDLKPTNVLITLANGMPAPKVIDFGIAKATGQQLTDKTLFTQFAQMVGTPLYMSPEQAGGGADVDTRSDVYSLGVLLYELLTGTTPFDRRRFGAMGVDEVRRVIRDEDPPKPSTRISTLGGALADVSAQRGTEPRRLRQIVRGELDWIVMRALEKDRNRRYDSADALASDVKRYLNYEAVQACPPSALYRFRTYVRRNRLALMTAALIAVVLVVATAVSSWQAVRAQASARAAQRAAAELALDKGQLIGESGDANLALLWLSRALTLAPPDARDLQSAIRAGLGGWRTRANAVALATSHGGRVISVGFKADDGLPFTVSWNADYTHITTRRWGTAMPGPSGAAPGLTIDGEVQFDIAVSPSGDRAVIGLPDGTLRLVDLSSGRVLWERTEPEAQIVCAGFSPDGTLLAIGFTTGPASAHRQGGQARLYDAATGQPRGPVLDHPRPVMSAAFHPDGKSFVTECGTWGDGDEPTAARFWDLEGRPTREPLPHPCFGINATFDPAGTRLLVGHWDRKARLYDLAASGGGRNGPVAELQHEGPVIAVAFSRDGRTLVTASFDGSVRLWDATGLPIGVPLRQGQMVQDAAISPDGGRIIVGIRGDVARLWELAPRAWSRPGPAWPLAVSSDGRSVLTQDAADRTVRVRDATTGQPIGAPLPHELLVIVGGLSVLPGHQAACSADRRRALTVERPDLARLWDVPSGRVVAEIKCDPEIGMVFAAAFTPDSRFLVTGHFQRAVHVWDAQTGRPLRSVEHSDFSAVFDVDFLPDGRTVLSAAADGAVRFWDVETGEPLGEPLLCNSPVLALALSRDGRLAVTGDTDRNVQLWDVPTRRRLFHLTGHQGGIHDAAFSPDGRLVLTGSRDGTARLWDVATGKPVGPPMSHEGPVIHVCFGPDGRTVRTALQDRTTHDWPVPDAVAGDAADVDAWAQFTTGMELAPDGGVRILDAAEWDARRRRFAGSGLSGSRPP